MLWVSEHGSLMSLTHKQMVRGMLELRQSSQCDDCVMVKQLGIVFQVAYLGEQIHVFNSNIWIYVVV